MIFCRYKLCKNIAQKIFFDIITIERVEAFGGMNHDYRGKGKKLLCV